jgi:hypothetical protein
VNPKKEAGLIGPKMEAGCRRPEVSLVKNTIKGLDDRTKHFVILLKRVLFKNHN